MLEKSFTQLKELPRWLTVFAVAILLQGALANENNMLERIQAAGVLRVANTQASPPWSFLDESNNVAGYDVDVAHEIARRLGIPNVEFIPSTFANFIPGIQASRYDMVISGQTITDERREQVEFSEPYQVNGVAIFVRSGNDTIQSLDDLDGKRVAVTAGSTQERFVRENIPSARVLTYETATLALTDIAFGRTDAALFSKFVGAFLAEHNNLPVTPLPELINAEVNGMSFKKGETAFKTEIDRVLAEMFADGTLSEISARWLGGLDMAAELANLNDD